MKEYFIKGKTKGIRIDTKVSGMPIKFKPGMPERNMPNDKVTMAIGIPKRKPNAPPFFSTILVFSSIFLT